VGQKKYNKITGQKKEQLKCVRKQLSLKRNIRDDILFAIHSKMTTFATTKVWLYFMSGSHIGRRWRVTGGDGVREGGPGASQHRDQGCSPGVRCLVVKAAG